MIFFFLKKHKKALFLKHTTLHLDFWVNDLGRQAYLLSLVMGSINKKVVPSAPGSHISRVWGSSRMVIMAPSLASTPGYL